jgi:2-polyprenyl-3-methyl-5-hydroxy-6-metoxy-1,4-benzoquinol methylase
MVCFAWLYMLGIIALSLNAAAQADGRYRSQYIFVEIPLALISISALVERYKQKRVKKILCQACETQFWTRIIGKRKQFSIWKCYSCGSLTVDPMPSEPERKAFYAEAYFSGNAVGGGYASYNADKIATRSTYEKMLDLLEPYRSPGAKMIDIGAASGMFVKWAQERGWDAIGQDISSAAAQMATENGVVVQAIPVEQIPVSTYAAVTALDVIEHVDQPRQFLRSFLKGLAPGGVMLINTPDAESVLGRVLRHRWHAVCPPEHVVLFSKKSLIQLVEQEGNEVVWVGRIPKTFRLSYIFSTAGRWLDLKVLFRVENWLKEHPRADISLPLPMRDNIALIARRRG